ncbi:Legumain [Aphelenchoides bicaudatus]|nr:Legumain [Aphelenchoides bicaudatus]
MWKIVALLYLLSVVCTESAVTNDVSGEIHAVLIAGSNTYDNYRHQADVSHAYHVLKDHGVKEENIITLMYDDIANNPENPLPGKIFNAPRSKEVYQGVKIDYKGDDVNVNNVMAILKGDAKSVKGGNGRVLESTKENRVFVFFVDHGAPGVLAVVDSLMTVRQLNQTLQTMYDKEMFGQLVFYLEACESGSMFEGILPTNLNILAITASNSTEPSWGDYCDDPIMNTCLGDLFSTNWLEDSDIEDLTKESMRTQFDIVKILTNESNVMKYGEMRIFNEAVASFQGKLQTKHTKQANARRQQMMNKQKSIRWPIKDIPLLSLQSRIRRTKDLSKRAELAKQLEQMKTKRAYHDAHTHAFVQKLLQNESEELRQKILTKKPKQIVSLDCHHEVVTAYHEKCFNLGRNSYAMNVAGPLNNLCDHGFSARTVIKAMEEHCAHKNPQMDNIR